VAIFPATPILVVLLFQHSRVTVVSDLWLQRALLLSQSLTSFWLFLINILSPLWNLDFIYPILSSLSDLLLASFHWRFQFMGQPHFHTIHHLLYIVYSLKSWDSIFWYYNHHLWVSSPLRPAFTSIKSWKSICFLYTCNQATKCCWRNIIPQICLVSLKFMYKPPKDTHCPNPTTFFSHWVGVPI